MGCGETETEREICAGIIKRGAGVGERVEEEDLLRGMAVEFEVEFTLVCRAGR